LPGTVARRRLSLHATWSTLLKCASRSRLKLWPKLPSRPGTRIGIWLAANGLGEALDMTGELNFV
jgi:hypothetical protein